KRTGESMAARAVSQLRVARCSSIDRGVADRSGFRRLTSAVLLDPRCVMTTLAQEDLPQALGAQWYWEARHGRTERPGGPTRATVAGKSDEASGSAGGGQPP